jgi:hypothetical protein
MSALPIAEEVLSVQSSTRVSITGQSQSLQHFCRFSDIAETNLLAIASLQLHFA